MNKVIVYKKKLEVNWNKHWVYLGNDFLKLLECEKRIIGKRISFSNYYRKEKKNYLPEILSWIERQRVANEDSLYWWMTHLAGKNNAGTKFFSNVLQLVILKKLNKNDVSIGPLLIICEDIFLYNTVVQNFKKLNHDKFLRNFIKYYFTILKFLILAFGTILKEIVYFLIHFAFSRIIKNKFQNENLKEIHIIHQCLDDSSFLKDGRIQCRYFKELPEWLEGKGKKVFRLPWFFNVKKPLKGIYKIVRQSNCFVPIDWISLYDCFIALYKSIKSYRSIKYNNEFPDIDIFYLIKRERLKQIREGASFSKFWCYYKALNNFCYGKEKVVIYSSFEMMVHEHVQTLFLKEKKNKNFKSVGYYHTLISSDFLAYHFLKSELKSSIFPNKIITNGMLGKNMLIKQGLEKGKILPGPALRQKNLDFDTSFKKREKLLITLPLSLSLAVETLVKIKNIDCNLQKVKNIIISVKPHPMTTRDEILLNLGWKKLPKKWIWENEEIDKSLQKSKAAIILSSGAIVDVVLAGVIPITLTSELDLPWNYLDLFEEDFNFLKPVGQNQLQEKIMNIFENKTGFYMKELKKLKIKLNDGLGDINQKNMNSFLKACY